MHNSTIDELLHICGLDRCSYSTAEFNMDTGVGRLVHCTNPVTWMDAQGNLFCDCHPTPDEAEQTKVLLKAIDDEREQIRWVESRGQA